MHAEAQQRDNPSNRRGDRSCAVAVVVILAAVVAYGNSLGGAFVFDDGPAIPDNPTLRSFVMAWQPPANTGVGGRPVANVSFALNHALGGASVWGYHVFNLLLHIGSALLLKAIITRTLRLRAAHWAEPAGGVAALLWCIHPLTTAAVSYLSQRTELLMGFFYLLTVYASIRSAEPSPNLATREGTAHPRRIRMWQALAVVACACGMGSKESMATAPLTVLLYDRTFMAGSFAGAWRSRRGFHASLAGTWLILAILLSTDPGRRSLGFGLGVSALDYASAQAGAILLYAKLAIWPTALVFDYGREYVGLTGGVVVRGVVLMAAVTWSIRALARRSLLGFVALCFFLLLAPTSSFVPVVEQPIAENRMYLPLAVLMAMMATVITRAARPAVFVPASLLMAVPLVVLTHLRNRDYESELSLWHDTVAKRPANPRAHYNLGTVLLGAGRHETAARHLAEAARLKPDDPMAHNNLGNALMAAGRPDQALPAYEAALRAEPGHARAHVNRGLTLFRLGRHEEAVAAYRTALQLQPALAEAHESLGNACMAAGEPARAVEHYRQALALEPGNGNAHYNCGQALLAVDRVSDAVRHLAAAVRLRPADDEARNAYGAALLRSGSRAEAIVQFSEALRLNPANGDARDNLELARRER